MLVDIPETTVLKKETVGDLMIENTYANGLINGVLFAGLRNPVCPIVIWTERNQRTRNMKYF